MCTDPDAFRSEIRSILKNDPRRLPEFLDIFAGITTPSALAELLEMPEEEMRKIVSASRKT